MILNILNQYPKQDVGPEVERRHIPKWVKKAYYNEYSKYANQIFHS